MRTKWVKRRLGNAVQVNPKADPLPEEFVYIDLESVKDGELQQRKVISRTEAPSRAQRTLRTGDVLFQLVRPYQQNNLFFEPQDEADYVASTGYGQIRTEQESRYFYYSMHRTDFLNRVLALCTGTGYPAIAPSELSKIVVCYPFSINEQRRIAGILSTCDEVITRSRAAVEKLRKIKAGMLNDFFTRGIDDDGRLRPSPQRAPKLYKDSPLGPIPKEWEVERLGDVCEPPQYGLNVAAVEYDGRHGYIRITDINDLSHEFIKEGMTSPAAYDDGYALKEGDIVFSRTGASVGKAYVYDRRDGLLYFAGFLIRFRCNSDVNSKFVFAQCITSRYWNWVSAMSMRTGQPGINSQQYATYQIALPKKSEQDRIAERLSSIDERIATEERVVTKYRSVKAGLMQRLLSPPNDAEIEEVG